MMGFPGARGGLELPDCAGFDGAGRGGRSELISPSSIASALRF